MEANKTLALSLTQNTPLIAIAWSATAVAGLSYRRAPGNTTQDYKINIQSSVREETNQKHAIISICNDCFLKLEITTIFCLPRCLVGELCQQQTMCKMCQMTGKRLIYLRVTQTTSLWCLFFSNSLPFSRWRNSHATLQISLIQSSVPWCHPRPSSDFHSACTQKCVFFSALSRFMRLLSGSRPYAFINVASAWQPHARAELRQQDDWWDMCRQTRWRNSMTSMYQVADFCEHTVWKFYTFIMKKLKDVTVKESKKKKKELQQFCDTCICEDMQHSITHSAEMNTIHRQTSGRVVSGVCVSVPHWGHRVGPSFLSPPLARLLLISDPHQ